ncbi:M15 family metallopeptidase [Microbacterium sp. B2969]|uniref:M15 family metallopeptidase n=1 Tax=Microbacterium alkaliflavum TaxID=3248839 RepID=A0ABW7Q9T0_9MICO
MTPPATRREARAVHLLTAESAPVRHGRARRADWIRLAFAVFAVSALAVGGAAALTAALVAPALAPSRSVAFESKAREVPVPLPQPVEALPAPTLIAAPALVDVCANPAFVAALQAGDDGGAIAAAGGAESFRVAVASGTASCVPLADPDHLWVVVNKARPFDPVDYLPAPLASPSGLRGIGGGDLRADASSALADMVAAAATAGAGEIALDSGFRSYRTQRSTYQRQVSAHGRADADMVSARPGYSEHQSGLAADVTACTSSCVGLESFAGTPQQAWVAAHSWEYGWIVRYVDGKTPVTGYSPEPWHLRYIGRELAAAYHDGGWGSLEEFLGLPAAPDYLD